MAEKKDSTVLLSCVRCAAKFVVFPYDVARGRRFCSLRCAAVVTGRIRREAAISKIETPITLPRRGRVVDRNELLAKFDANTQRSDGCWTWNGSGDGSNGYGMVFISGAREFAHRVAYLLFVGPLPSGREQTVDHLCRNRMCVNPSHLELVTAAENKRRGMSPCAQHARKTHCIRGHEFTPDNTVHCASRPNGRQCRACVRIWDRERGRRDRAAARTEVAHV